MKMCAKENTDVLIILKADLDPRLVLWRLSEVNSFESKNPIVCLQSNLQLYIFLRNASNTFALYYTKDLNV